MLLMFFANGMFFCTRSRVWEALVNDAMTHLRHGGEKKEIISPLWESDFHSYSVIGV